MERFDAAVIGAGPEGLIAAHRLAKGGLKVVVLDRAAEPGGRAVTREFHPGFRASPYADELPPMPRRIFAAIDPARRGAILTPARASSCFSRGRFTVMYNDEAQLSRTVPATSAGGIVALRRETALLRTRIAERGLVVGKPRPRFPLLRREPPRVPWPGEEWGPESLETALAYRVPDPALRLHLAAEATTGRSTSPFLAGTALHLLTGTGSGVPIGGLANLAAALADAVRGAGGIIRCGADVEDIKMVRGRITTVTLAGGEEIAVRAVISALDVKRTFMSLLPWKTLPERVMRRVARFRMRGGRARVLLALDRIPQFKPGMDDAALGPIHVVDSLESMADAHESWRAGVLAERLPVTLRVPSMIDPRLAPIGKAVMTVTISGVPLRLFDGPWDGEKRARLVARALLAAEQVAPGIVATVQGVETILPSDIEEALGLTDGDLDGGELAQDQALGFRPFQTWQDGRTAIHGLYLGGPSSAPSPFLTGVAGEQAALALLADIRRGRLK